MRGVAHQRPGSIAGVVFVDAITEETPKTYPNRYVRVMSKGLNTLDICVGLDHAVTTDEWVELLLAEESLKEHRGKRERS